MSDIEFYNIRTNNLKGIDIKLKKHTINCITGPSGSGKSTLAFDTIYAICEHEYMKIMGKDLDIYNYKVDFFDNLLIATLLKQINYNTNPRSTIATYYGMDKYFKHIFAALNNTTLETFSFNKYINCCKNCKGLGYIYKLDKTKIIDYNSSIEDVPFYPWRNTQISYYKQILKEMSDELNIKLDTKFRDLDDNDKDILLYGEGNKKYKIAYIQSGRKRVKTGKYIGIMLECEKILKKSQDKLIKYYKQVCCDKCSGSRFDSKVLKYNILGMSIADIYLMPLQDLYEWLSKIENNTAVNEINNNYVEVIKTFIKNIIKVNLGYLNFNRAINSLSGGEFQRLRLSQLLNSKLSNILFVLDEPLTSLHIIEKEILSEEIKKLIYNNTVLIVEHNIDFIKKCGNIITLGYSGGINGGHLVGNAKYIQNQLMDRMIDKKKYSDVYRIKTTEIINNVKPLQIEIPKNTCIGIGGVSGSGKSTFIKNILPMHISNYVYISQKPIKGNIYSTVASYIEILDNIRGIFSKESGMDKSLFSSHYTGKGCCEKCRGIGKIKIKNYKDEDFDYVCPQCDGIKYNEKVLKYKYFGYSINEVLELEISQAKRLFEDKDKKIYIVLKTAEDIGLGYIRLNQMTSSLSGGENQRIKLVKHFGYDKKNLVIALDEPFQGLNNIEIYNIMKMLYKAIDIGKSIIIVEHNILALSLCSYIIEFGKGGGIDGGNIIFQGNFDSLDRSEDSILKKYLLKISTLGGEAN